MNNFDPEQIVIIDIDGLRRDVFNDLQGTEAVPNLNEILFGEDEDANPVNVPALSVAPSITFAAQATILRAISPRSTVSTVMSASTG